MTQHKHTLSKLDLDYVDLYLLHQPIGDTFGAWRALEELYKEGKIRSIGVSNFKEDQLANISLFNEITPAVNQIEVHVFNQKEQQHAYQTSKGVVTESWGAFAEGKNDVFNHPILKEIAQKHKKTTAQVMLRWQLQRGIVSLSKSANPERVRSNFDIFDCKAPYGAFYITNMHAKSKWLLNSHLLKLPILSTLQTLHLSQELYVYQKSCDSFLLCNQHPLSPYHN